MDDESRVRGKLPSRQTRRQWLLHCSLLALALSSGHPAASAQIGSKNPATPLTPAAPVILVVGDSLSAEYGLSRGSGWVALLDSRLKRDKVAATVVNASISGDTTSGGVARLPALLASHHPTIVVLELGANDALRGLPLAGTRTNLEAMATAAEAAGAKVAIIGIQVPPNYGRRYGDEFSALFGEVAQHVNAALVPSMLKGVADVPNAEALFQADRIHPTAAAHPTILDNIWPVLRPLIH